MLVSPVPKDERKGRIKPNDVIYRRDNTGATATSSELPAVCPVTTLREETTTLLLTELVAKQAKNAFSWQVAGTVGTPGSCYS